MAEKVTKRMIQEIAAENCCAWTEDEDGNWETACGRMFVLVEGTPSDNSMAFCCYCGKSLAGAERPVCCSR